MISDYELLRHYAENGDQEAFAEFVRRYIDLAYSVAVRVLGGANTLTADVVQTVFTDAARKAFKLSRHPTVVGWLHTSVRLTALDVMRREHRRQVREQEAATMQITNDPAAGDWESLCPFLDEAIGRLRDRDRQAILLRFFQDKSHREIGEVLGVREEAARKCVTRALEQLRGNLARRGVTVPLALLGGVIATHSIQAAPVGLAATVSGAALAGTAAGGAVITAGLVKFMSINKIAAAAAGIVALTIVGFGVYESEQARVSQSALRAANQANADLMARLLAVEHRVASQDRPAKPGINLQTPPQYPHAGSMIGRDDLASPADPLIKLDSVKDRLAHIGNLGHSNNLLSVGIDDDTVITIRAWMKRDPEAALQWLGTLPSAGNQQMHTIEAMIGIEVGSDPDLAFQLANSISLDSSRLARIGDVIKIWAPQDPSAASRAVQSADIPEPSRAIILNRIAAVNQPTQR